MIEALAYDKKKRCNNCSLEVVGETEIEMGFLISVGTVSP